MTLNPQALTEAARALCKCEYPDMADSWHDIAAPDFAESATLVVTAYLSALPPISEAAIVAVIRAACTDWDDKPQADGEEPRSILNCYEMRRIANTIERLSRELDARGASHAEGVKL